MRAKRTNVTGGVPHVRASLVAPPPRPPLRRCCASPRSADPPRKGEGCHKRLCVVADVNFKQPLLFRHASSPPLFAARGRRRGLHSHPLVRGRAERRVPVAPLGLMRMRSSAWIMHQDFRRRRAIARRSACGVFSVACTSAMANGPITKINVPGRRDRVAAKHLAERVSIWSSVTLSRVCPSQGRPCPCQWQCWRRSVLPEDRRSP
ncbi:hypothetical protein SAMN05216367_4084 [Tardiphaga sp. OK245]|nr:hypothetical protein SAMN05216367_4084 [Tardiphaga sp. OK245]